jgi:hypothetical protein
MSRKLGRLSVSKELSFVCLFVHPVKSDRKQSLKLELQISRDDNAGLESQFDQ